MSAGLSGIGPLSVRYAHQIKELLNAQAVRRMAAEQESARASAEAERARRVEAIRNNAIADEPVKVDVRTQPTQEAQAAEATAPVEAPAPKETVASAAGQLVDEMA